VTLDGRTLPLQATRLRAEASGGLARVVLEQRFLNPHPDPLHVTYLLPLPVDGAVSGFAFRLGERLVVGEIDRLEAARERFEAAIVEGRTAGRLDEARAGLFSQTLGNLPGGAEVVAEVTVDQRLRWLDEGAWEWRFPTVVAPRYLGAPGRVADAAEVTVDTADRPLPTRMALALRVRDAVPPSGRPASASHVLRVTRRDDGLDMSLADEAGAALDRDLVVSWPAAGPEVGVALQPSRAAEDGPLGAAAYGLLTVVPPAADGALAAFARDVIVLLDTSGSMSGSPIEQARAVVAAVIDSLGEGDRLEMIAFADAPRRWSRRPTRMTTAARTEARRWLDGLTASGGTEMREGIAEALRPLRSDAQRQVVLITDGLIGFEGEIVDAVARDLPAGSRLHAVGVGSAINRALTAAVARAGRGTEVLLGLDDAPEDAARRLVARTRAPLVTDLILEGSALLGHVPARLPDLLAGGPALVGVKLRSDGGQLRLRGRTPAGDWSTEIGVAPIEPGVGSLAVLALYGREAVDDLELEEARGHGDRAAAIEHLGLAFQIATRRTSWVAVSEEPTVDPGQPSRRERIPHGLPDGLSAEGLGLRAPAPPASVSRVSLQAAPVRYMEDVPHPYSAEPPAARSAVSLSPIAKRPPAATRPASVRSRRLEALLGRLRQRLGGSPPSIEAPPVGATPGPPLLVGQVTLRRGRELVIEIAGGQEVDWRPASVTLEWADGTRLGVTIDVTLTTRPSRLAPGQIGRLVLRLPAEAPTDTPIEVLVVGGSEPLTVPLQDG
jgi:Ca-activated chloride channel family protein